VDWCPPIFLPALGRCRALFDEARRNGRDVLLLVQRRDAWMHNSWFSNLERMKRNGRNSNPLGMNPTDVDRLGLRDGDAITVTSAHGSVQTTVQADEDLMVGVVSMVHGWGHAASPRMRVAAASPGANPNALLPIGEGSFEPLSSQAHMTGIAVTVRPSDD